jgi:hypothetical protein
MSFLGYSADIQLGMFESPVYVKAAAAKASVKKATKEVLSDKEKLEKRTAFFEWVERAKGTYRGIPQHTGLKAVHKTNMHEAKLQWIAAGLETEILERATRTISDAYYDQLDNITPTTNTVCPECGESAHQHLHRPCRACGGQVITEEEAQANLNPTGE